jgi:hypothetical protein
MLSVRDFRWCSFPLSTMLREQSQTQKTTSCLISYPRWAYPETEIDGWLPSPGGKKGMKRNCFLGTGFPFRLMKML